jgi:hypothetical protein
MRKMMLVVYVCIAFWLLLGIPRLTHADSAEVLPKGVCRANVKYSYYTTIDEKFDPDGDEEDLAADFNDTLNSNVFPGLALVEEGFGLSSGSANIGDSVVDFKYDLDDLIFNFQYGLTDKITLGIEIPYYWNKNNVHARLDATNATVGFNPLFNQGMLPPPLDGAPFIPTDAALLPPGVPPGVKLTDEQVQELLGAGLDVDGDGTVDVEGYGYERVETWDGSGISDIEVGMRYQYLKTENWRLAFTGGVRLPTGDVDDPDNLVDIGFGTGAWALLFRLNNDYTGIENLVLNATFKYDLVLPDEEKIRVLDDVNEPITRNKEKVDRDLGDMFELQGSGTYDFSEAFSFALLYKYRFKLEDDVDGDKGFAYESLEEETDWTYHGAIATFSYSTIPLFKAERCPLPLTASIEYKNIFAGSNNFLKQQAFTFELAIFF